jgi:putative membrane protein
MLTTTAFLIGWPPRTIWEAAVASAVFGLIGILLVILGFKLFDWLTPGKLQDEIIQKNNIAAAILAGAFIVGICIVIAAAVG